MHKSCSEVAPEANGLIMKKVLAFLYFTLLVAANLMPLSLKSAAAASPNLVTNSSVETANSTDSSTPQGWLRGGWGTNTSSLTYEHTAHTGSRSVKVQISSYTDGDAKWYFSPVAINGGSQYTFSDYYESSIASDIVAQFDDGTGKFTYVDYGSQAASANWSLASFNFTAPATAKSMTMFHLINRVGWLQTDDFSLTAVIATPTAMITSPSANSTVNGVVQISASASAPAGIASVQFQIDGVNFGSPLTTAPYQVSWDTTKLINGIHQISAAAITADGQTVNAVPVMVTISNAVSVLGNIISNPSVEAASTTSPNLPQDWSKGTWGTNSTSFSYLNTGGHAGTRSLKVQMSGYSSGASYWYFKPQPVLPNQQYDFKDYYKANVVTEIDAGINLSDGTTQYVYLGAVYPDKTNWTKFETQFTTPANAVSVSIYHSIYSVGWLQTDDFSLSTYSTAGFNRPIISLAFDDGWESYYKNGVPLLNKYGFTSTDYIISGYLGDAGYITKAQVKQLYAMGHEIGSHTVDHPDLTSLSAKKLNTELKNSQATLQTAIGAPVTDFASPYGAYNQTVLNDIQRYYASHRSVETGFNAKSNFDVYDIKVQNMVSTTTLAQFQSWVSQAKATNTWLVLVYHQVDSSLDKAAEPYNTYQSDLDAQLAYIKSSGIPVETVKQAVAELKPQL